MNIPIIYEDNSLLVIDKPAGTVVNRSKNVVEETIQDWAEEYIKVPKEDEVPDVPKETVIKASGTFDTFATSDTFYSRSGIVHRLDKETSGILLIAKNPQVFRELQSQFKNRTVVKKYMALTHGRMAAKEGLIKAPVGRLPWNRRKFGVVSGGRIAETNYRVLSYHKYKDRIYTLLEVTPHTGRTHQIRIHLKYLGYSIVGDYLYAGRKIYKEDQQFCSRLFLHATSLCFKHPVSIRRLEFRCELPDVLQKVIAKLSE